MGLRQGAEDRSFLSCSSFPRKKKKMRYHGRSRLTKAKKLSSPLPSGVPRAVSPIRYIRQSA